MNELRTTISLGDIHAQNTVAVVPKQVADLLPIVAFLRSKDFYEMARKLNTKVMIPSGVISQVPFDLTHWQSVAEEQYPHGLPEPHSDDPTQWLFKGNIVTCVDSLHVTVARLLGYRWPDQPKEPDAVDALVDDDGIVCLPGVRGESPAAERLLEALRTAYGVDWSDAILHTLLTNAGCKAGATLEDWLRNQFFEQHCKRFAHRPFILHVWDGRKDGFSAFLNYHKLNHKTIENLTYSYLGDWIKGQNADAKAGKVGADLRLAAAQELHEKLKRFFRF